MFHVGNGIYFERQSNGDVRVVVRDEATHTKVLRDAIIKASGNDYGWCSVVADMSAGGEHDGRFYAAKAFHESTGKVEVRQA